MVLDKMARTKWYRQNGTDKMVATFIESNSTELKEDVQTDGGPEGLLKDPRNLKTSLKSIVVTSSAEYFS